MEEELEEDGYVSEDDKDYRPAAGAISIKDLRDFLHSYTSSLTVLPSLTMLRQPRTMWS